MQHTRKALKFLHSLAACGMIGALLGYAMLLVHAPQETPAAYADMRQSVSALCNYMLFPSLAVVLVSGVFSMAAYQPFQGMHWVWIKALMGLGMFEGTLAIIGTKARRAAELSARIAEGADEADALAQAIASEWQALGVITALSVASVALGVWRPRFSKS